MESSSRLNKRGGTGPARGREPSTRRRRSAWAFVLVGTLAAAPLTAVSGCKGAKPPATAQRTRAEEIRDTPHPGWYDQRTTVAFHSGRLWSRDEGGRLWVLGFASGEETRALEGENVVDLLRTLDDELWLLVARVDGADVLRWAGGEDTSATAFRPLARLRIASPPASRPPSRPLALGSFRGRPVVLTQRASFVVQADGSAQQAPLSKPIDGDTRRPRAFAIAEPGIAYLGENNGEFGGSLRRIDLATGVVEELSRLDGSDPDRLCGGVFNPACDPVTAIIADPDDPRCVLAGVGLHHMWVREGKLLRVCDRRIEIAPAATVPPLVSKRAADSPLARLLRWEWDEPAVAAPASASEAPPPRPRLRLLHDEGPSPAIFGLARTRDGYWMARGDDLIHVEGARADRGPLPWAIERRAIAVAVTGGLVVSFSGMNGRVSVGGSVGLVAPISLSDSPALDPRPPSSPLWASSPAGTCWRERPPRWSDTRPYERPLRQVCFDKVVYQLRAGERRDDGPIRWRRGDMRATDRAADWVGEVGEVGSNEALLLWIGESSAILMNSTLPDEPPMVLDLEPSPGAR